MGIEDYLKRVPAAVYPYYITRAALQGLRLAAGAGFYSLLRGEKPWLPNMAKSQDNRNLPKVMMEGRPADYKVAVGATLSFFLDHYVELFIRRAREPEKLIWHEDLIPPEIIQAMDLIPFMVEEPGIMAPIVSPGITHYYIDVAENAGYPGDICTLPKTTLGMVLEDMFPPPRAIITSNSPCDGGMAYFLPLEQKTKVPVFRIDWPYDIYHKRAQDYCLKEVRHMIRFLEDLTGQKMDMDKLKEICELRNRTYELTLELWEMIKHKPCPMGGDILFLSHLVYQVAPGTELAQRTIQTVLNVARERFRRGEGIINKEQHRAILWNPPPLVFPEMCKWMEEQYGTVTVMDMLTFNRHPLIDTSSEEAMLRDLTMIMSAGPMARHTRGPAEYFFDDLFRIYEEFQADMIIMAAHQNCKNTRALLSMFRDYCRRDEIPLLIIDYDLSDARVASPEDIKRQVANFMDTVVRNH